VLYYLERSRFKSVTSKYLTKYDRMRKKSDESSADGALGSSHDA
jgi:hypothetical protein